MLTLHKATTMRLLVSHQPPASHFCQPHVHSLFYYLHVIAKMMLLCMTVADINSRKALLPWEIIESHSETDIIREFFNSVLVPMLAVPSTAMEVPTVSFK